MKKRIKTNACFPTEIQERIHAVHLLLFNHLIIIFQLATFRLFWRLLYMEANLIIWEAGWNVKRAFSKITIKNPASALIYEPI